MPSPFPLFPDKEIVLPPAYAGGIGRFALIAACGHVKVDNAWRYDKRFKLTHRTEIADTRGPLRLTVPLQSQPCRTWADARISDHGRWREIHLTALASAYGRTPYFEFYIDRLAPIIEEATEGSRLVDLDSRLEREMCRMMSIPAPEYVEEGRGGAASEEPVVAPYWQVRADKLGFIAGRSMLDLLFNLGPEAPRHLLTAFTPRGDVRPDAEAYR